MKDPDRELAEFRRDSFRGAKKGLLAAGEHILGVSNAQTPHEEGDLIRSGGVSQDERTGETAVSYDTPYAVRQHEDMSLHHDPGRNAKYLERSLASERATALKLLAAAIKRETGL